MRAVLVERGPESWSSWADVALPRVKDLVESLRAPEPLVPWEYASLDPRWLQGAWALEGRLPEESPLLGAVMEQSCALGVGTLGVSPEKTLSPGQWRAWRGLPPELMGCPLDEVVRWVCAGRYPLVTVGAPTPRALALPENPEGLYPILKEALGL